MVYLCLALGCIGAWFVPNLGIEVASYRLALTKQANWHRGQRLVHANRRITHTELATIVLWAGMYTATAYAIGRSTQMLDERAIKILQGLSFFLSSVIVFLLSIETPMWLGVYYSRTSQFGPRVGRDLAQLTWNVATSISRIFLRGIIITCVFFCGVDPLTIPICAGGGLVVGHLIWSGVYIGRTKYKEYKTQIAIVLSTLLSMCSSLCFMLGCTYIHDVWGRNQEEWQPLSVLAAASLLFGLVAGGICHYLTWLYSQNMFAAIAPDESVRFRTVLFAPNLLERIQRDFQSFRSTLVGKHHQQEMLQLLTTQKEDEHEEIETTPSAPLYGSVTEQAQVVIVDEADEVRSPTEPFLQKVIEVLRWIVWITLNAALLYVIVVNIGASQQTTAVMKKLPSSYAFLYPPDYNNGTVCAWDKPGADATIRTFSTPIEAAAHGFSVIHCGACGKCSNWNDLTLQWTTRHDLALQSQHCAKQFVLGGGIESVHACNRDEIGFTDSCARCWTNDEVCAKNHCVFIFLQGVIINKLTSFEVGPGQITSATCDEAMCGPYFGPCSGAIRRRMNIKSSIARPQYQQCHIIDQDWATVFDHP